MASPVSTLCPAIPYVGGAGQAAGSVRPAPDSVAPSVRANYFNFNAVNRANTVSGSINTAFPSIKRVDTIKFTTDSAIVSVLLSTTMQCYSGDTCGIFVIQGDYDVSDLNRANNVFGSHLSLQNFDNASNVYAPVSRTTEKQFGPFAAVRMLAGSTVSIYACGTSAYSYMVYSCSITTIPLI